MGTSTDAILAFGFDLGEELPEALTAMPEDEDDSWEFEAWAAARAGLEPWSESRPDDYWERRRAAIAATPYDLITHYSYDYPMYFLAARGTEVRAYRGTPKEIDTPEIPSATIDAMRAFCAEFGIEWQEPRWHIFSLWG